MGTINSQAFDQSAPAEAIRAFEDGTATHEHLGRYLSSLIDYERLLGTNKIGNSERDFQLEEFRNLMRRLGSPHQACPVIHVAGTKGKGSTCAMVASILRAHGLRVGQYTSPHLERYTERIQMDGREIEPVVLGRLLLHIRSVTAKERGAAGSRPDGWRTLFEQLTTAAFLHFQNESADVAVIETGLGGRLDATNIHNEPGPHPVVAVITTIGLDHVAILGDTPGKIASEKAGILHGHTGKVIGRQPAEWSGEVWSAFRQRVASLDSAADAAEWPIFDVAGQIQAISIEPGEWRENARIRLPLSDGSHEDLEFRLPLLGEHQVDNACCAVAAVLTLERMMQGWAWSPNADHGRNLGWRLVPGKVRAGLEAARWPARFEVLDPKAPVIIDGAHCPLSVRATCETLLRHLAPNGGRPSEADLLPLTLVLGVMRDKDLPAMIAEVKHCGLLDGRAGAVISGIIATQADWPRAVPAGELAETLARLCPPTTTIEAIPNPESAFAKAVEAGRGVVGLGSLYLPAPFRRGWLRAQTR